MTSLAFTLLALGAAPVFAQATAAADLTPQLIGTWEGPYQSEQAPPGSVRLVIAKEAGEWRVSLGVVSDQEIPSSEVKEFAVDGNQISWVQEIMGMECRSLATLDHGTLTGGTECGQSGAVAILATFVLLKQ
jgi:hypothetical protein